MLPCIYLERLSRGEKAQQGVLCKMNMIYTEDQDAERFLAVAQAALERHECANGLMLEISLRLVDEPEACGSPLPLGTVESGAGLRVVAVMTAPPRRQVRAEDGAVLAGLVVRYVAGC